MSDDLNLPNHRNCHWPLDDLLRVDRLSLTDRGGTCLLPVDALSMDRQVCKRKSMALSVTERGTVRLRLTGSTWPKQGPLLNQWSGTDREAICSCVESKEEGSAITVNENKRFFKLCLCACIMCVGGCWVWVRVGGGWVGAAACVCVRERERGVLRPYHLKYGRQSQNYAGGSADASDGNNTTVKLNRNWINSPCPAFPGRVHRRNLTSLFFSP